MRTLIATNPGTVGKANEDGVAAVAGFVVVADGATARTDTGCIHGVAWFAQHLVAATVRHAEEAPDKALALGIQETADAHRETCNLDDIATPGAAIAIVQIDESEAHFLALGDVSIIIDSIDELKVIVDQRVDQTAVAERAAADALPSGSAEKSEALVAMKQAELAARNVEGGFWVAAADPAAVAHAVTWSGPRSSIRRCAVLTDGAARIVTPFGLVDWRGALDLVAIEGPSGVIDAVRRVERDDSQGERWPRNKISDDATVAYIKLDVASE